jgi:hypothetical protein
VCVWIRWFRRGAASENFRVQMYRLRREPRVS